MNATIDTILSSLTLEEKASLCSGKDFWHSKDIEHLGVPSIMLTDGPHGLRKQTGSADMVGLNESVPATCFPTASATACSWDRELMEALGRALGEECQQEEVSVILGPGVNTKRSPLCGRNFEYVSEDPYLGGELAASLIQGVQSQGVGTSLKHFAVNDQETLRMVINAVVDERALREIYLTPFEIAVKKAQPWTVMCSYNKVDGIYVSENERFLTRILRDEWGFEGMVVTDWGACNDRVAGLKAGQDLEMPSSGGINDVKIVQAVKDGKLDESVLDQAVRRLLAMILKAAASRKTGFRYDVDAHQALARRAAAESAVLLKNQDSILPLKKETKIALIGAFAKEPRYQGSGSSKINPSNLLSAHDELAKVTTNFTYSAGYQLETEDPQVEKMPWDDGLIHAAIQAARQAEVALIFAGLPGSYETEGLDRQTMRLPESHNRLIHKVAEANPNTVVVLSNGSPVEMVWFNEVKGILEGYLGGQAGGGGIVDVLFGFTNPCGKLAETFPFKLQDTPTFKYFPGGPKTVEYRESLFVGYRYYDKVKKPVLFPFGFGMSYTSFAYSDLQLSKKTIKDTEELKVSLVVKNTGKQAGAEVVQVYVHDDASTIFRPEKELKGFDKVFLQPGESKRMEFTLNQRSFAYYNTVISDWHVETGLFEIQVGSSSAVIHLRELVRVESTQSKVETPDLRKTAPTYYSLPSGELFVEEASFRTLYGKELPASQKLPGEPYSLTSTLGEIKHTFIGKRLYNTVQQSAQKMFVGTPDPTTRKMLARIFEEMPLRNLVVMGGGQFKPEVAEGLLLLMNGKWLKGLVKVIQASRKT